MKRFLRWLEWYFWVLPKYNFIIDRACGWTVVESLSRCWMRGRRRMFPRRRKNVNFESEIVDVQDV